MFLFSLSLFPFLSDVNERKGGKGEGRGRKGGRQERTEIGDRVGILGIDGEAFPGVPGPKQSGRRSPGLLFHLGTFDRSELLVSEAAGGGFLSDE